MSVVGRRLREARLRAGLSQEKLGLEAGLEAESARARMNRYERGTRAPDFEVIERIGAVLGLPAAYFYASDENLAEVIAAFGSMTQDERQSLVASLKKGKS